MYMMYVSVRRYYVKFLPLATRAKFFAGFLRDTTKADVIITKMMVDIKMSQMTSVQSKECGIQR